MSAAGPPQGAKAPSGGSDPHEMGERWGPIYCGRFAPSPTGLLHAGSLAAALASWLDARAHGGTWLVRMEDTDTPRCLPGADTAILQQLSALGLVPDETPLYQSKRSAHYERALAGLLAQNQAYPCTCTRSDIERVLRASGSQRPRHGELVYPGTCRHRRFDLPSPPDCVISANQAIRLRTTGLAPIHWLDRRLGAQQQNVATEVGDFVLRRADGLWAYQLAVVVDDAAQGITHVVRGQDLADNTARQILLQQQLGLPTPHYLHVPLVLGADGHKLSKQNGAQALDVGQPLTALNAAARVLALPAQLGSATDALTTWTHIWADAWAANPPATA